MQLSNIFVGYLKIESLLLNLENRENLILLICSLLLDT